MLRLTEAGENVLPEGTTPAMRLCHALFSEPEGLDHHQIARLFGSDQLSKDHVVFWATKRGFILGADRLSSATAQKREVLRVGT